MHDLAKNKTIKKSKRNRRWAEIINSYRSFTTRLVSVQAEGWIHSFLSFILYTSAKCLSASDQRHVEEREVFLTSSEGGREPPPPLGGEGGLPHNSGTVETPQVSFEKT